MAQDIFFPDLALGFGQQVPPGHVPDMDEIEAGLQVGRHAALEEIHDHLAGGGGAEVPGAHGGAGIDHHQGQALAGEIQGHLPRP